jgi:GAF domain-containing protein/HAMP domain-containing protein
VISQKGTGAARALDGQIDTDTYALPGSGEEVVGYYAPINDTPLALVAEAPSTYLVGTQQTLFDARFLIIVLATPALVLVLTLLLVQLISTPIERLRNALQGVIEGDYNRPVRDTRRADEIGRLANTVVSMREQVQSQVDEREVRIAERGRDMAATQAIGHAAVSQTDVQTLLDTFVNLIVERFPLIYHAQVFIIDPDRRYAVLQSSTNEPGRLLLARGHRLAVGSISVVGQATEQDRSVVTLDTAASPVHRRNELLPDTVAELAIPLHVGSRVIGALDVQSRQRDAFDVDLISVLETVADQISVAYQSAQLYQESLQRAEEVEQNNRLTTLRVWQEYMREQRTQVLAGSAGSPVVAAHDTLRDRAMATGEVAVGEPTERNTVPLAVPVVLRGQPLGVVEWEIPVRDLDQNRIQLAEDLAARLAVSLDNARLFEDSARTAERERLVNNIAAKLAAQTDIDNILQTAVREIGLALRAPQVSVKLGTNSAPATNGNGNGHSNGNGNGHHYGDLN